MNKLIIILSIIIGITFIGYKGYQYIISAASDQVIEHVVQDLLNDEMVDELLSDPRVEELVHELVNQQNPKQLSKKLEQLPFTTKEEGVKVVLNKFSVTEIKDIATQVQDGLTADEQVQLVNELKNRLTEEEIEALMIIGVAELQKEIIKKTP